MEKKPLPLRSAKTYGKLDRDGFIHRSWMMNQGLPSDSFDGRPIIGICQTFSEFNPCHSNLRRLGEAVKRGVWQAGGVPLEFPTMSLGETQIRPTAMLFRNLMSMDVEESIRGYAMDGVVLLGGCDKNTPAQLMGAASVNLPAIVLSTGPMLNGKYRGKDIGSGTDVWRFSEDVRAGSMTMDEFLAAEAGMSRSRGTCMTMGTASTMACIVEAMGLALPYNGTIPGVDARREALAHETGIRIVQLVLAGAKLSDVLTRVAFENAIRISAAIGGSTNAVLHLLAIAGRASVPLALSDWQDLGSGIPLLVDLMPAGRHLMEDFHYAGGVPAVMRELGDLLDVQHRGVSGFTVAEIAHSATNDNSEVIRSRAAPLSASGGLAILRGSLAPGGAVMKTAAASPALLQHRGQAVVFESIEDFKRRIDDPSLDVTADSVLVLKGCGPRGYPGMPEVGNMPLPRKLLEQGVRDMVRISDARMSGTAFGTVVLHVVPEAHLGGPLAIVQNGDWIFLDALAGRLDLQITGDELAQRLAKWHKPPLEHSRGWKRLYTETVTQADEGADLTFLRGGSGSDVSRESH